MVESLPLPLPLPLSLVPPAVCGWDTALMGPLGEINEQLLEYLRSVAVDATHALLPRLLQLTQAQWLRLDACAIRRLAACPYLLLDLGFAHVAPWQRSATDGVMDQAGREAYFRSPTGIALLRRTLVLAWHVARSNRLMAAVALGMSAPVAESLARKRLKELEALADRSPAWMLPRWERQPVVWRQMIDAACGGHPLALRAVYMRGWQLLARERYAVC